LARSGRFGIWTFGRLDDIFTALLFVSLTIG
jgi:hypothetical protein